MGGRDGPGDRKLNGQLRRQIEGWLGRVGVSDVYGIEIKGSTRREWAKVGVRRKKIGARMAKYHQTWEEGPRNNPGYEKGAELDDAQSSS